MSRFLLKASATLFVVAALVGMSFAQDNDNIIRPSTKAGSAAWVFQFGGLATMGMGAVSITTANNTAVVGAGYKYYLSDDMALRAMLGFSTTTSGDEATVAGSTTNTNYGIAAGIELHTHAVYSTSPYFGAQISFGGASSTNKSSSTAAPNSESKSSGTTFGIAALAGFDWYFTHGLAVGAEYMLGFSSMSSSTSNTPRGGSSTTTDNPSVSAIGITNGGNVHLVVHF